MTPKANSPAVTHAVTTVALGPWPSSSKQKLTSLATALLGLWTRGLNPTSTLPVIDRETGQLWREGDLDALYQAVEFYSDGTLGPYGKYSNLTVGGWGWCALGPPPSHTVI